MEKMTWKKFWKGIGSVWFIFRLVVSIPFFAVGLLFVLAGLILSYTSSTERINKLAGETVVEPKQNEDGNTTD